MNKERVWPVPFMSLAQREIIVVVTFSSKQIYPSTILMINTTTMTPRLIEETGHSRSFFTF